MDRNEVIERLVRIETKLDKSLSVADDHETRVRSLEREQWLHRGGASVVAVLVAKLGLPWFSH